MSQSAKLTATEREVLDDVARGLSNIQIALRQFRSHETIRTHVKNLLAKLKARNRAHAMIYDNPQAFVLCHYKRAQALCHRDAAG
ncbi:helix-turn-helix transcriptional regulator [Amycolatopsis sp. DG1A-15b]|uniref:helix-turn-helix domain-containing protein n=1 Tax=Amycolatopsis sp. DG1A-15b TaxID=3052846 RepID=UPI00255B6B7C|nr:helix-turn-helix transcriptional regulator [Amycolatopsis sp. DG1A-15b]WIX85766.1 helix-turn-helix transcriptional regulator [Amycolatopsis sp. DG1A-15b]